MAGRQADTDTGVYLFTAGIFSRQVRRETSRIPLCVNTAFLENHPIPGRICVAAAGSSPFMTVTSGEDLLHFHIRPVGMAFAHMFVVCLFVLVVVCIRMKNTTRSCSLRSKSLMALLVPTCSVSGCLGITVVLGGDSQVVAPCEKCLGTPSPVSPFDSAQHPSESPMVIMRH